MQDNHGEPLCLGSGFFVDRNTVVTNFHVVDQAGSGYAKLVGESARLNIRGTVGLDPLHDLALLEIESSAPALPLAAGRSPNVGDAVYVIGNPEGLEGTFSPGVVSGVREFGSVHIIQMTAPISPGSSGGPVLDQTGSVIGVAAATWREGQNLNFALPSEYIADLQKHRTELQSFRAIPHVERRNTLLGRVGGEQPRVGVVGENFKWAPFWEFSFSLRNKLAVDVSDIHGLIIFYNYEGQPLDTFTIEFDGVIPAHLAKRLTGKVDESVGQMWQGDEYWWDSSKRTWHKYSGFSDDIPNHLRRTAKFEARNGKIEFRILNFTVK
jgi:hypothetical protein